MARTRKRWLYPLLGTAIAVIAYLYGLNSIHIPNIGDESRYIQIARMTASSGSMLPLISERGIDNTKPPMLFWQGILTTAQGKKWTPLHLRVPIVFYSFAIAVLVGFLSWKISGASLTGWLAGFIYLGFMSTIQQGRPFLTNAPETFFLFLPLIIVFFKKRLNSAAVIACGLSLGAAALYKSFFLVFVGVIALAAVYLHREDWKLRRFFRTSALPLIVTGLIGLAVFSLWFLLDPNPELIFKQFVLGENAGKFSPADFVTGLFSGSYPVWRIWLGNFANAGFYAPLLIALVIDAVKRRGTLSKEKKRLWVYIAAILAVYTFPTQRQENYILPTTAALSVLLALRWRALASGWFRASFALIGVFLAASLWAQYQINLTFDDRLFDIFNYAAVTFGLIACVLGIIRIRLGKLMLPVTVLWVLFSGSLFLRPFSSHFSESARRLTEGRTVYFPNSSGTSYEKYYFILPGAEIHGYRGDFKKLDSNNLYVAGDIDVGQESPPGFEIVESIYNLKTRLSDSEINDVLFRNRYDLLVNRLAILKRVNGGRD